MAKRTIVLEAIRTEDARTRYIRAQCDAVLEIRPGVVQITGLSKIGKMRLDEIEGDALVYLTNYKGMKPLARIV